MTSADTDLREELTRLRTAVARRLREKLEDEKQALTPAFLDVARRFLSDQGYKLPPDQAPRAPLITTDLPFPGGDDEA